MQLFLSLSDLCPIHSTINVGQTCSAITPSSGSSLLSTGCYMSKLLLVENSKKKNHCFSAERLYHSSSSYSWWCVCHTRVGASRLPGTRSVLGEIMSLHHLIWEAMQTQTLFWVTVCAEEERYGWEGRTWEVGAGICSGSIHNEGRNANYIHIAANFKKLSKLLPAACSLGL